MKQPKQIQVDGQTYTIQPYLTSFGMRLLTRIFLILGKPLVTLAFGLKGEGKSLLDAEIQPDQIAEIMDGLYARLTPEEVDQLFKDILVGTLIGNTSQSATEVYDTHFSQQYGHLFKVVFKSLEAQYGDFFGALGGLAGLGRAVTKKPQ